MEHLFGQTSNVGPTQSPTQPTGHNYCVCHLNAFVPRPFSHSAGATSILFHVSYRKICISKYLSPWFLLFMQEKCLPVYCQYKFHNLPVHRTHCHKHAASIYFRDINVVLSGLMSPRELREFLCGPPLQIEVHDRDTPRAAASCGPGRDGGTWTDGSPVNTMPFNYHGIASLSLLDLLLGKQSIQVNLPIKCCSPPLHRGRGAAGEPLPAGHYLEDNSRLKVKVELACPLDCEGAPHSGQYGRIIYLLAHSNLCAMTSLRSTILRINAAAFRLSSCSLEHVQQALSNHTLNFEPDESDGLDFVSGFHVLDERTHIFVLEGLKHKAVRRLWETVPMK